MNDMNVPERRLLKLRETLHREERSAAEPALAIKDLHELLCRRHAGLPEPIGIFTFSILLLPYPFVHMQIPV